LRKGDCLPLTLLNMQVLTTLLTARAGGCCLLTGRRDAAGIAEWIAAERVTVWNGVPAQLHDLARHPEWDLSSLEEAWCGGAGTPEELRTAFEAAHHVPVRATYGLSEAPTVVAIDPVGSPSRPGVSGRVLPHLDVAAYSPEGVRLPPGEEGELCLAPATAGQWADAWTPPLDGSPLPLPTGDIGRVGADGWLTVTDRRKLIIVRGGANVYPAEVERVIRRHPAVADVAVFGIPDERLGEKVAALVQFRGSPDPKADLLAVEALCRADLARYKVPETWSAVDAFPLNAMGKIIRTGLAALLKDLSEDRADDVVADAEARAGHDRATESAAEELLQHATGSLLILGLILRLVLGLILRLVLGLLVLLLVAGLRHALDVVVHHGVDGLQKQ
jgi:acyl-CoA synthetase (AMP-forming)/AMP-acid ligase II